MTAPSFIITEYKLPDTPGSFSLDICFDFVVLGVHVRDNAAFLLVHEPEAASRHSRNFISVASEQPFTLEMVAGEYLGSYDRQTTLHLFGPKTQPKGRKKI